MSALLLAIPLTIFVLFVAPIWLWLHYHQRAQRGGELAQSQRQQLVALQSEAQRMQQRIQALEQILDSEHAGWRQL